MASELESSFSGEVIRLDAFAINRSRYHGGGCTDTPCCDAVARRQGHGLEV